MSCSAVRAFALFALVIAIAYMLSGYYGLYSEQKIIYSKLRPQFIDRKPNNQPSVGRDDSARRICRLHILTSGAPGSSRPTIIRIACNMRESAAG